MRINNIESLKDFSVPGVAASFIFVSYKRDAGREEGS
jgi:hypothetical protein